jgi:SH3-like domain-containing protein
VRFGSNHRLVIAALALVVAASSAVGAEEKVPRFASLRADTVNLRTGPGERYPVEWVYQRKGLPVEVTAQSDVWRRVRDPDGTEGWVHERMLTSRRSVVVTGAPRTLRSDPDPAAHAVARVEPGVIARLLECKGAWCRVESQGIKGWLPRAEFWGVFPDETVVE